MTGGDNRSGRLARVTLGNWQVRGIVAGFASVTLHACVLGTAVAIYAHDVGGAAAIGLVGFRFVPAARLPARGR
jgi:hypothetical protein